VKFEIKNRWTGAVQYSCELSAEMAGKSYAMQLGFSVKQAVAAGANLAGADLARADLADAYLADANLARAYLARANLAGANLAGANLAGANLAGANLAGAYLADANLAGANLARAYLARANLAGAYLADANLAGADLARADLADAYLAPVRDDIYAVLSAAPGEAIAVRDAIASGRVDGSVYQGGCACLVGTIANARGVSYEELGDLRPSSSRPAERFFMAIRRGDTPETNAASKLAHGWVSEWIDRMQAAFAVQA